MQKIVHLETNTPSDVVIELMADEDFKLITKGRYFFNWKKEKGKAVYKLRLKESDEILGLMTLEHIPGEMLFEIKLLATGKENCGKEKLYEGIAENLIAYACREAVTQYGEDACVSLFPKTKLRPHYIVKYGMEEAGIQVFLAGPALFKLLQKNGL